MKHPLLTHPLPWNESGPTVPDARLLYWTRASCLLLVVILLRITLGTVSYAKEVSVTVRWTPQGLVPGGAPENRKHGECQYPAGMCLDGSGWIWVSQGSSEGQATKLLIDGRWQNANFQHPSHPSSHKVGGLIQGRYQWRISYVLYEMENLPGQAVKKWRYGRGKRTVHAPGNGEVGPGATFAGFTPGSEPIMKFHLLVPANNRTEYRFPPAFGIKDGERVYFYHHRTRVIKLGLEFRRTSGTPIRQGDAIKGGETVGVISVPFGPGRPLNVVDGNGSDVPGIRTIFGYLPVIQQADGISGIEMSKIILTPRGGWANVPGQHPGVDLVGTGKLKFFATGPTTIRVIGRREYTGYDRCNTRTFLSPNSRNSAIGLVNIRLTDPSGRRTIVPCRGVDQQALGASVAPQPAGWHHYDVEVEVQCFDCRAGVGGSMMGRGHRTYGMTMIIDASFDN